MGTGPFGVDLDAAVEEINAKQSSGGSGEASADVVDGASDPDLAPDTALEGDASEDSENEGEAEGGKDPKVATPKTDEGTEFGVTPDGKIQLYGKEYSPVELALALEKIEKIEAAEAERAKFQEHFDADIDVIKRNPALVYRMQEQGYPVEFVRKAVAVLRNEGIKLPTPEEAKALFDRQAPAPRADAAPKHPFEAFPDLKKQWDRMNSFVETQIVHGLSKDVDSIYDKFDAEKKITDPELSKRARKDADVALQALSKKDHAILDDEGRVRSDVVRRVYSLAHQKLKTQIDKRVRSVVTAQKKANSSVRDNGNGGVVPTRPAEKPKTLKEATKQWLREVEG